MDISFNLSIKPFSVNQAWTGKKYKTENYRAWRADFSFLIKPKMNELKNKNIIFPIKGFVEIHYEFYVRFFNKYDVDNFVKATSDALVENEILEDDRFVKKYVIEKFPANDLEDPHIEVKILPWEKDLHKIFERKK